jgi:D-alanyl-lipoteichoic acid acyltransferase DltB (MBOAT superfamily)
LSTWLRDYLFIPLGGSRGTAARTAAALFLTMLLGGLWHGAAWTFVVWGAFHGAWLVLHRIWSGTSLARALAGRLAWRVVATVGTFHLVCLGWVLFRAPTLAVAGDVLSTISQGTSGPVRLSLVVVVALSLASQWVPDAVESAWRARLARLPAPVQGAAFAGLVVLLDALGPRGVAPFIYFQF